MSEHYQPLFKPYVRSGEVIDGAIWPQGMNRVALGIEYKGTHYHGFQVQPNGVKTVQQSLEFALSRVADENIALVCAGRTDAGVHATNQVVHFDTLSARPEKAWLKGTRPFLPDDVVIRWACPVIPQFHARFSAQSRTYRYLLSDAKTRPALLHDQVTWYPRPLDIHKMKQGAAYLIGEHDFTSIRATQCQAKSPIRCIEYIHLVRRGDLIILEVRANAFLHHMVRNIVGVLQAVGSGDKPPSWVGDVLQARDRSAASVTAKPYGLYLVGVDYPAEFNIPSIPPGPLFFDEPLGGFAD
jgi:tRNA pseudouridine38-40 synthase